MGEKTKKDYSLSLLSFAAEQRLIDGCPLAFGEGGVKGRMKNVLNFKKPSRVILIVSIALVAVLSVGFAVNRATSGSIFDFIAPKSADKVSADEPDAPASSEVRVMTLEDVHALAQKGEDLLFEDFRSYQGMDVSSHTEQQLMIYGVDSGCRLGMVIRNASGR